MWYQVEWREAPIVNANKWLKWTNLRIWSGTRQAARLANQAIRRENREIRHQRGKWM